MENPTFQSIVVGTIYVHDSVKSEEKNKIKKILHQFNVTYKCLTTSGKSGTVFVIIEDYTDAEYIDSKNNNFENAVGNKQIGYENKIGDLDIKHAILHVGFHPRVVTNDDKSMIVNYGIDLGHPEIKAAIKKACDDLEVAAMSRKEKLKMQQNEDADKNVIENGNSNLDTNLEIQINASNKKDIVAASNENENNKSEAEIIYEPNLQSENDTSGGTIAAHSNTKQGHQSNELNSVDVDALQKEQNNKHNVASMDSSYVKIIFLFCAIILILIVIILLYAFGVIPPF